MKTFIKSWKVGVLGAIACINTEVFEPAEAKAQGDESFLLRVRIHYQSLDREVVMIFFRLNESKKFKTSFAYQFRNQARKRKNLKNIAFSKIIFCFVNYDIDSDYLDDILQKIYPKYKYK